MVGGRNQEKKLLIENGVWVYKQTRIHYTPPLSQGNRTRPLAPANKGVGRHRQGGAMPPPWRENSFILTIEATKNQG